MTSNTSIRFVIVGPGAVGGTIAAELQKAAVPVVLLARGAEAKVLTEGGIRYLTPGRDEQIRVDVASRPEDLELTSRDVFIVTTKSQDTESVLQDIAWLPVTRADGSIGTAASDLPVVVLQNGITNERTALRWFTTVYGGVLAFPVDKKNPGEVISYSSSILGIIWLGTFPSGSDARLEQIAETLGTARLATAVVDDIRAYKATKLSYNTVNAIEPVFAPSDLRDELKSALFAEGRAVFEAQGLELAELWESKTGLNDELFDIGEVEGHARSGNSTWQSFSRGAAVETDYLNGDIVLEGKLTGIPTPLNRAIQQRIRDVIAGRRPVRAGDDELIAFLEAARATETVGVGHAGSVQQ